MASLSRDATGLLRDPSPEDPIEAQLLPDTLTPLALAVLTAAGLATSVLSAVVGMAGGITLLAVMLLFLDPLEAIPLHGAVQLVSNGSRAFIQRAHIRREIAFYYALPLLPMGVAGLFVAEALPANATRALIGVFVLVATWAPGILLFGAHPEKLRLPRRFLTLGSVTGVLNMSIGATGPLIAPFFLELGLTRFELVGTKAACQAFGHIAKIVVFGVAGFAFGQYALTFALLACSASLGTVLGSRILDRVSERFFTLLYRTVLTAIALHLLARELLALVAAP